MRILKKTKDFCIICKDPGIPSQPDPSGDKDAMTLCCEELAALGEGRDLWLIHRLDRVVGGLMVFARSAKCAAALSEAVKTDSFVKEYLAVVEGNPGEGELFDYIFKDARAGKAFLSDRKRGGFKEARLAFRTLSTVSLNERTLSLLCVRLYTGRFHQIRAQLASRGMPLIGDGKYGSRDKGCRFPALFAYRLGFCLEQKSHLVHAKPPTDQYPWNLFPEEAYE